MDVVLLAIIDTVASGAPVSAMIAAFLSADQTRRVLVVSTRGRIVLCPDMVPILCIQPRTSPAQAASPRSGKMCAFSRLRLAHLRGGLWLG